MDWLLSIPNYSESNTHFLYCNEALPSFIYFLCCYKLQVNWFHPCKKYFLCGRHFIVLGDINIFSPANRWRRFTEGCALFSLNQTINTMCRATQMLQREAKQWLLSSHEADVKGHYQGLRRENKWVVSLLGKVPHCHESPSPRGTFPI